jgi:hypothetical protein
MTDKRHRLMDAFSERGDEVSQQFNVGHGISIFNRCFSSLSK